MSFRKLWPGFFFPCHPTNRDGEKLKTSAKGHRNGHSFQPVTPEERLGRLCLFSWVKRRWGGESTAAHGDLKESYKMTKSNSSWWCQTTQEGKNPTDSCLDWPLGEDILSRKAVQHWKGCPERPQNQSPLHKDTML